MITDEVINTAVDTAFESFWETLCERLERDVNVQEAVGEPWDKIRTDTIAVIKQWAWNNSRRSYWKVTAVFIDPATRVPLRQEFIHTIDDPEPTEFDAWESARKRAKEMASTYPKREFSLLDKLEAYNTSTGLWHTMPVPETWSESDDEPEEKPRSEAQAAYSKDAATATGMYD